ncbi:MAG: protein kinase [Bacillota bacterium]|nr:protein kinase [Bacillota bacterium]
MVVVRSIHELSEKEKIMYICEKEGYEYVKAVENQSGVQAKIYLVRKNGNEYIVKFYDKVIAGGYGKGLLDEDGTFNEKKYLKEFKENDELFKIEKAIANDTALQQNCHIVDILTADSITFSDGVVKITNWYIIMKRYQTLSLDRNVVPNIREEKEVLRLATQICDALILLNGKKEIFMEKGANGKYKGIYHGDIKWENIFFEESEAGYTYVLSDFGLSKLKGSDSEKSTVRGGTEYAMAPELAKGRYSTKADLYALCATLYLLLNEGDEHDAPKSRIRIKNNKIKFAYKGKMPQPKNASNEMQDLLVNALEFKGKNRRCKNARELKVELQRIQINHAAEAYDKNNLDEYNSYINDLDEIEIEDSNLLADVGELIWNDFLSETHDIHFILTSPKYMKAKQYIDEACKFKNPKAMCIKESMLELEKDCLRHIECDKSSNEMLHSILSKDIEMASMEKSNDDFFDNSISGNLQSNGNKRCITKLICICTMIIATMGSCLIAPMFVEFNYRYAISGCISIMIAIIMAVFCRKLLRESPYSSVAVDLIGCFFMANISNFMATCIIEIKSFWCTSLFIGIAVLILIGVLCCVYMICDEIIVSPIKITNHITYAVVIIVGGLMICFCDNLTSFIEIENFGVDQIYRLALCILSGGVLIVMDKICDRKEIGNGIVNKEENKYTVISVLLIVAIITVVYFSIDILSDFFGVVCLLILYVAGIWWVGAKTIEKRNQKHIWLISFIIVALFVTMLQLSCICGDLLIDYFGRYIIKVQPFNIVSIETYKLILLIVCWFMMMKLGRISLFNAFGAISVTFHRPLLYGNKKFTPVKVIYFLLEYGGCTGLLYATFRIVYAKDFNLGSLDLLEMGVLALLYIIYNFVCNATIYKLCKQ